MENRALKFKNNNNAELTTDDSSINILAKIRQIMSKDISGVQKLLEILKTTKNHLNADAIACYGLMDSNIYNLISKSGYDIGYPEITDWSKGQGIIGNTVVNAVPISLTDKSKSIYYSDAEESKYTSLCAVPITRGSVIIGVLVIENLKATDYSDEVIEILQTVSMLLAELLVASDLIHRHVLETHKNISKNPYNLDGKILSQGLGIGNALFHETVLSVSNIFVEDSDLEKERLKSAINKMNIALSRLLRRVTGETKDILEAYQMLSQDLGWINKIKKKIDLGLSSEAAIQRVQNETRLKMLKITDPYIRERLTDFEDVSNRLLTYLTKDDNKKSDSNDDVILIARSLGPAALLDYDLKSIKGIILEGGNQSNHVSIVAKSFDIPVLGQCENIRNHVSNNDKVILDAHQGIAFIRPSDDTVELFEKELLEKIEIKNRYRDVLNKPAVTKDGMRIYININAGLAVDMQVFNDVNADGIGLFRTEFAFMGWSKYPSVAVQTDFYKNILQKSNDKHVTFRTLDIGGDKPLPYFKNPTEDNPALGWRAVRIGLDRPALFKTQFRALIRAAAGEDLKLMLPMVADVEELIQAKKLFEIERLKSLELGFAPPKSIKFGVMLEVPSLIFQMDKLLKNVDFISIGTNDLMQYLFAADRGNYNIKKRYDCLSPAMLSVLIEIKKKCDAVSMPVTVCGEMASNVIDAMALVSLGFNSISINPKAAVKIKLMVNSLDVNIMKPYINHLINSGENNIREELKAFALDHNVNILAYSK